MIAEGIREPNPQMKTPHGFSASNQRVFPCNLAPNLNPQSPISAQVEDRQTTGVP